MLTTENAKLQPLNILKLGFPVDTQTQEGLAMLSDYLSGHLTIHRLKELVLRVMAVEHMIKNYNFVLTYNYLINKFDLDKERSFNITARVYRGGGYTKDYLYLSGFKKVYNLYKKDKRAVETLLVGKSSILYLSEINELISREQLFKPKYIPPSFRGK